MTTLSILSGLKRGWQHSIERHRSIAELCVCPPRELHRVAAEVGLSDAELGQLADTHPGPTELLPERLEQLGLDVEFFRHARTPTYRHMEGVCATCKQWRRCARDLERADVQTGMDIYCLNAPTIDALMVERT